MMNRLKHPKQDNEKGVESDDEYGYEEVGYDYERYDEYGREN